MSTPVFPVSGSSNTLWGWPGLKWGTTKTPQFKTSIQTSGSGREARTARWVYPLWTIELAWDVLRDDRAKAANVAPTAPKDELRTIEGFFLARRGSFDPFFFTDPTDHNVTAQTIGTGDGVTTDFPAIRTFGVGASGTFAEPVGGINTVPGITLTVGGVPKTIITDYAVNTPVDGYIRFVTPPANTAAIVASFSYYFKVRFVRDEADFANFTSDLWELQRLEMRSVR